MKIELNQLSAGWRFQRCDLPDLNPNNWEQVTLPHTAHLEPEICNDPWFGICCYQLPIFAAEAWRNRIVALEIDAAMQKTEVYVNGKYHSAHCGGYRRFRIPLTDVLNYGAENTVTLRLDNRESPDFPPGKPWSGLDFCYYSGLYRSARLVVDHPVHISDPIAVSIESGGGVFLRTLRADADEAELEAKIHIQHEVPFEKRWSGPESLDKTFSCRIAGVFRAPDGSVAAEFSTASVNLRPNTDHTFTVNLTIRRPALWSPDTPALYRAEFTLFYEDEAADTAELRYGIRTLCFRPGALEINGQPIRIIGTNRHQDYPYVGNAVPPAAQKRDAMILKRAGYNFVRLSHYNQHPAFLDACDELGICVAAAIPGWQYYNLTDSFVHHALRDCRELVRNERNRPSVILWEVSLNESYPPSWLNEEFHRTAHREYPGDQCFSCGDTYGLYEGWDVLFSRPGLETEKPVLVREYGDWSFGGNESTSRRRRGDGEKAMRQQAWNFQWMYNQLGLQKNTIGGATWAMFDYNRGYHHDLERSGDADLYRVPRYKYHFYRSQGAKEPMVFIASNWNAPESGDKVVVYSNCDEVELLLNGRVIARQKPDSGPTTSYNKEKGSPSWETALSGGADGSGGNPFDGGNCEYLAHPPFTFFAPGYEPGELRAIGYRDGKPAAEMRVSTPGEAASLQLRLRDEGVPAETPDLLFLDALLTDAAGTVLCGASDPVTLEASGAAAVIGDATKALEAGLCTFLIALRDQAPAKITARCGQWRAELDL